MAHDVAEVAPSPPPVAFLDGIQQWRVVGYDGVVPIVRAYVAAAVRRRGADRRLRTAFEDSREFAVAPLGALGREQRAALEAHVDVVDLPDLPPSQPGPVLEAARRAAVTRATTCTRGTCACGPGRATICCSGCCGSKRGRRRRRSPPPER